MWTSSINSLIKYLYYHATYAQCLKNAQKYPLNLHEKNAIIFFSVLLHLKTCWDTL